MTQSTMHHEHKNTITQNKNTIKQNKTQQTNN